MTSTFQVDPSAERVGKPGVFDPEVFDPEVFDCGSGVVFVTDTAPTTATILPAGVSE